MPTSTLRERRSALGLLGLLAAIACSPLLAKDAVLRAWPAGVSTPPLQLEDLDGRQWNLAGLRGKVVILNFWATWCENCIEEMQFFNDIAAGGENHEKPTVLSVNFKESATTVHNFSKGRGFVYPILMDRSGDAFKLWAQGILPTTILVDRKGRARWRVVGALDADNGSFRQMLEALLKE